MLVLQRFAYSPQGTFGRLTVDGRPFSCFTVERAWADNAPNQSCIPEGRYPLRKRPSLAVTRSSGGEFVEGWEVTGVPGRSLIMLHPGNTQRDVEGCIAPGDALGFVNGAWAVLNSRATFRALMYQLDAQNLWQLTIASFTPGAKP